MLVAGCGLASSAAGPLLGCRRRGRAGGAVVVSMRRPGSAAAPRRGLHRGRVDLAGGRGPASLRAFPAGLGLWLNRVNLRGLAQRYGGDRAATDVARVMRLPGFRNCKPGRARALITWTWYGGRMVRPEDFGGLALPEREPASRAEGRRRTPPGHHSQSERDWAAAGDALRKGEAPETVISRLEQQRQDKPNPGYYARRTVQRKAEELKRGYQDGSGKSR